jgi:hypothetical protein
MTTSPASSASSQQANIDAALLVLKSMGLSPEDLTAARAYGSYWKRVIEQWRRSRAGAGAGGYSNSNAVPRPARSKTCRVRGGGERRITGQSPGSALRSWTNARSPAESRKPTPARSITSRRGLPLATSASRWQKASAVAASRSPQTVTVAVPWSHWSQTFTAGTCSAATAPSLPRMPRRPRGAKRRDRRAPRYRGMATAVRVLRGLRKL